MIKDFQVLKDNGDGTIDIEAPVFKKFTLPHPKDANGNLLSGNNLIYMVQKWVRDNAPSDITDIDASAHVFDETYGLNENSDDPVDTEALGLNVDKFPVGYAG